MRSRTRFLWAALAGALTIGAAACNAVFGVRPGEAAGDCQKAKPAVCAPGTESDDEGCCVAGRSCQGGTCVEGECQPVDINGAPGTEAIDVLVADDVVVWSTGWAKSIHTTKLEGGARATLLGDTDTDFMGVAMIALDADRATVYFTDFGGARVGRVGLDGRGLEMFGEIPIAGARAGFGRLLVHDDHVYLALEASENTGASGVFRARVDAAPPVTFETVSAAAGTRGLAVAKGYLYFGDEATQSIQRISIDSIGKGGAPETVVPNQPIIGQLAVDQERLYWPDENSVWAHDLTPGGTRVEVGGGGSYIWGIAPDEDYIYWTTMGDSATVAGELWRVDRALEAPPRKLYTAAAPRSLSALAGDCDTIYFLDRFEGRVLKISK